MNFFSPNWIYAGFAAAALIVAVYVWASHRREKLLEEFASAKLLPELSQTVSGAKIALKKILFLLGVFAVFFALARPQWGYRWEESKARGIDVVFAIDVSKSMLAEDVSPNRLERAKLSVLDLLNVLDGDRIGIVAFSGQAFLQCPLTLDYDAFKMSLEALDTNVIQRGGTNIAAAISEAEVAFSKTSNKKVIVLISDGEELESSAVAKAKEAAKNDVIIYTLGVGGTKGEAIRVRDDSGRLVQVRDENGKIVTSRLNEPVLTEVAKATGGFYEPLTANGMDTIYEDGLKKIPQQDLSARMKRLAIERFQIPLGIAIILLALESLVGTRKFFARRRMFKSAMVAAALLPLVSIPQNSEAADAPKSPQQTESTEAPKPDAREIFNKAVELLDNGEFANSKELFTQAMKMSPDDFNLHAKAFYNMGNADYDIAKSEIEKAEAPEELAAKAAQLNGGAMQAMQAGFGLLGKGRELLKQETDAVAAAKTEAEKKSAFEKSPLKNQQFQQQLKQTIGQCEAFEKGSDELKKQTSENGSKWSEVEKTVGEAISDYESSAMLDPSLADAKQNIIAARKAEANLKREISKNKNLLDALSSDAEKQKLERIAQLKEELKKLVRDDNNQQNQNQQNQQNQQQNKDNQQNQQNQDKQNQDKQDKQNQDKQNQDKQDKQNQQNKDQQNKEQQKQDKEQQQNQQQQKSDSQKSEQDKKDKGEEQKQNAQDKRDEQAVKNREEKSREEQAREQAAKKEEKKPEEQAASLEEIAKKQEEQKKQAAAAAQKAEEEKKASENYRAAVGAMTKGEAKQLLESMKDSEKILPLQGYGEQKDRYEKSYKDW